MGNEVSLARQAEDRREVLLAGAGTVGAGEETSCRDQRPTQDGPAVRVQKDKVKAAAKKSKDTAASKADDRGRKPRRRPGNKSGRKAGGVERANKSSGRSAEELGIEWPDVRCEVSSTKAHFWVARDCIEHGTVFECKYCHRFIWLPDYYGEAIELAHSIGRHGHTAAYQAMLAKHPVVLKLLSKIQDLHYLRGLPQEQFLKVVVAVMTDREYPYATQVTA